jgi:[acyl-carrier-protein] S-malonyltransferase
MSMAFVFPGQGSQEVGMGKALADAFAPSREVFEEIDDALGQNLSKLMFEGPDDELRLTENAQPALMAVSMAVMRTLAAEGGFSLDGKVDYVAGHSLGEYSALAAAGAFGLGEAARLLKIRGRAMQEAVPVGEGAMAALLGLDLDAARDVAEAAAQGEVCQAANDNAPGQVVVSGHATAVERALEIAKKTEINAPAVPLVANVTAESVADPDTIRRQLVEQVTGAVRWRESVLFMKNKGVDRLVEAGAGKVLSGLARRIDRELTGVSLNGPDDIEEFLKSV